MNEHQLKVAWINTFDVSLTLLIEINEVRKLGVLLKMLTDTVMSKDSLIFIKRSFFQSKIRIYLRMSSQLLQGIPRSFTNVCDWQYQRCKQMGHDGGLSPEWSEKYLRGISAQWFRRNSTLLFVRTNPLY